MRYILIDTNEAGVKIYKRIDDDGIARVTCTQDHPALLDWIAEGNTPEEVE